MLFARERGTIRCEALRLTLRGDKTMGANVNSGIDETHAGLQKLYFVCFSRPARPAHELEANLEEHKAYLSQLEREGKLLAAGPLLGDDAKYDGNGLLVYRVSQRKDAEAIANKDPFHVKGLRTYTLKPWQVNEGSLDMRLLFSAKTFSLP
jgi:uncharacterized protein YciI